MLAAATVLLRELRKRRVVEFDNLLCALRPTAGSSAEVLFAPAVSLLFLLGLLEYRDVVDSFEYVGR